MGRWPRIVVHADLDAFYAAVEQLDDPSLRGKPILVGPPTGRGVVLTASYEARPFGVGSAMPMAWARRKCPQAIVVPPRFERYTELSGVVMDVFADFSPEVEPISLDEAFLEMTGAERLFGGPREMGSRLKEAVREATGGLTVSVGVSGTKYVAKVASDHDKPDGLTIVPADEAVAWLAPQPVRAIWGVGPKTGERLAALGLKTVGDIQRADPAWLSRALGPTWGPHIQRLAHAEDPRRVTRRRARSIGSERTLAEDVRDRAQIEEHLRRSAENIGRRLRRKSLLARGVRVKLKTASFQLQSRQSSLNPPTDVAQALYEAGLPLLDRFEATEPFRLVGMAAYDLVSADGPRQLGLFTDGTARRRRAEAAMDSIRDRFGKGAVQRAENLGRDSWDGLNLDFLD